MINERKFKSVDTGSLARRRNTQAGLGMIELMIAMVLGLIVVSAVMNVYVGSARSSNFSNGLRAMQENGRYGIDALRRGLRLAGYSPNTFFYPVDIANSSDIQVSIRTVAQYDCNGVDTTPVGGVAVNTYAFDAANNVITCRGNSASATNMALVDGVDEFSILYGIDTTGSGTTDKYEAWNNTIAESQVRSLRLAFLSNSLSPIRSRDIEDTYVILDKEIRFNDRFARNVFSTTVLLRNGFDG